MGMTRADRYIQSRLRRQDIIAAGEDRWIGVREIVISRNDADTDDAFDQSSSYSHTVYEYRLSAKIHRLANWDRRRLLTRGIVVTEGDVLISDIPYEYKEKFEAGSEIVIYTHDLTSMNSAIVVADYPADEQESSWLILARRTT